MRPGENVGSTGIVLVQLAQRGLDAQGWLRLMAWLGAIVVVLIAGLAVMMYLKKRVNRVESDKATSSGLLDHLRELKREGKLSDEEFEAAKRKIAEKLKGQEGSRE